MNTKEFREELLKELILHKNTGNITRKYKELVFQIVLDVSESERYQFLTDVDRSRCEARAYNECCKYGLYFDPEKKGDIYIYFKNIIRCAFTQVICIVKGNYNFKITIETNEI